MHTPNVYQTSDKNRDFDMQWEKSKNDNKHARNEVGKIHENNKLKEKSYLKRLKTTYNKGLVMRLGVTYWQLKVMVFGVKPVWAAFDRWQ